MATRHKLLILNHDEDEFKAYKKFTWTDAYSAAFKEHVVKTTNSESFQEGKRVDTFDMVIALFRDKSEDDIEMAEEFYNHYLVAPVAACLVTKDDCVSEEFVKNKFGDHVFYMEVDNFDGTNIVKVF